MTLLFNDFGVLHRCSFQHSHILSDVKNINQADSPVETTKLLKFTSASDFNSITKLYACKCFVYIVEDSMVIQTSKRQNGTDL